VKACKQNHPDAPRPLKGAYLLHDKAGLPYSKNALDSALQRIIKKAMKEGAEINGKVVKLETSFTFHDLKATGISDHESKHGGHRSEKMRKVYDRLPEQIKATK
jgi:hypothetical protein